MTRIQDICHNSNSLHITQNSTERLTIPNWILFIGTLYHPPHEIETKTRQTDEEMPGIFGMIKAVFRAKPKSNVQPLSIVPHETPIKSAWEVDHDDEPKVQVGKRPCSAVCMFRVVNWSNRACETIT